MLNFLLDASDTAAGGTPGSAWTSILLLGGFLVIMYFFMIRPQKKQEKQVAQMRNSLQVGDEITTTGGIIGKIISIKDETIMIETGRDKTKLRLHKSAVRTVDVRSEDAE